MVFKENKAIYLQIADKICDDVLSGNFLPDTRIPSVREYASSVEVNANTVMRAYDYLQQQSVIYNKRGIGFFISPDARNIILEVRKNEFFADEIDYFFNRLLSLGVTARELAEMYEKYSNNPNDKKIQ